MAITSIGFINSLILSFSLRLFPSDEFFQRGSRHISLVSLGSDSIIEIFPYSLQRQDILFFLLRCQQSSLTKASQASPYN
jgi:hypothetical protein